MNNNDQTIVFKSIMSNLKLAFRSGLQKLQNIERNFFLFYTAQIKFTIDMVFLYDKLVKTKLNIYQKNRDKECYKMKGP